MPSSPAHGADDLWADISYTGDLCRLFDAGTGLLEGDDFHNGLAWSVKIGRFGRALRDGGLQLRAEPLARKESVDDPDGILLDSAIRAEGIASIDAIAFTQRMHGTIEIGD